MRRKKVIICPHCNTVLPNDSEFCTACGEKIIKQSAKNENSRRWKIATLICSVFLAVSICVISIGAFQFFELQEQLETETAKKIQYYDSYYQYKMMYNNLQSKDSSYQSDYWDAVHDLYWYENHIAFVVDGSDYYHTKNCYSFKNADEYWAYNIEAAKSKGYSKCPFCH